MENIEIINLLERVSLIRKFYDKMKKQTGEEFNIFNILGVTTDEVKAHSSFIGELLNPKGTHGQEKIFLELFLDELENNEISIEFNSIDAVVEKEKYIGQISKDYTEGGNIDLIITNKQKKAIIIENKIYAVDQEKQLLRYFNYAKKTYGDNNFLILYLNLNGSDAKDISKVNLKSEKDYFLISYKDFIISWLEECIKEASKFPILRENIQQYIYLIKNITNQLKYNDMEKDIRKEIENKPEYIDIIIELNSLINKIKKEYIEKLQKEFENAIITIQNIPFYIEVQNDFYVITGGKNDTQKSIDFKEYKNDFFIRKREELIAKTKLNTDITKWAIVGKRFDINTNLLNFESNKRDIQESIEAFQNIMSNND